MNRKKFFKHRITPIVLFTLFSVGLAAQDTIQFTWEIVAEDVNKEKRVSILATQGEDLTVDWGDGTIETKTNTDTLDLDILNHVYTLTGEYTVTIAGSQTNQFIYFECFSFDGLRPNNRINSLTLTSSTLIGINCRGNQLTSLDLSGCPAFKGLICEDNQLTNLDVSVCPDLVELHCGNNQLTHLNVSGCIALRELWCEENQLTNLYITSPVLWILQCQDNQLASLDISSCLDLQVLYCFNNQLLLSDLLAVSENMSNLALPGRLGTQNLLPQTGRVGQELFADQSVFNGIFTEYAVTKNDSSATNPDDYTVVDGKLTFNTVGNYIVTMTNSAIISSTSYPAKVIIEMDVNPVGIVENALQKSVIYPNPTRDKVYIKTENGTVSEVKLYSINGRLLQHVRSTEIDLSGYATGIYLLQIDGETKEKLIVY